MNYVKMIICLLLLSSVSFADEKCPELSGTYLCGSQGGASFYVDVVHFHPEVSGDYFDVYLLYHKYQSHSLDAADTIIPIVLVTDKRYWTNSKLPANQARGLQVQASCEIGKKDYVDDADDENLKTLKTKGEKLFQIYQTNVARSFEEKITVSKASDKVYFITEQKEGTLEGEPSIESCKQISSLDPNYRFGRMASGWRSVQVEIKLLVEGATFPAADNKNVLATIKGTHHEGKVLVDIQSDIPEIRDVLPGEAPNGEFRKFLQKYGFDLN